LALLKIGRRIIRREEKEDGAVKIIDDRRRR